MSLEVHGIKTTIFNGDSVLLVQTIDESWYQVDSIIDPCAGEWPFFRNYVLAHSLRNLPSYDVVARVDIPKKLLNEFLHQRRRASR